ncbi:MAG: bifunctional isocitrate dehydrogenase kinase/phosphatase [Gammaproteobacteria bacterium]
MVVATRNDPELMALAQECAGAIRDGFTDYNNDFREITHRARRRFEQRDWQNGHKDAVDRIDLYEKWVQRLVDWLVHRLQTRRQDRQLWKQIKIEFSEMIRDYVDQEFTKTYFSSITRRIFDTVGIDPEVEYIALEARPIESVSQEPVVNAFPVDGYLEVSCQELLIRYGFDIGWEDLDFSVNFLRSHITDDCQSRGGIAGLARLEFLRPVFYQGTRAYLVGRMVTRDDDYRPLVVSLRSTAEGVAVDAVLTQPSDVSVLFGFTRSYFHADLETVADAVVFLRSIMPRKPLAELFTVLGRAKQGKTERYRSFFRHLSHSEDSFVHAPGDKGMVMVVFTLPSYDIVFKIIRDQFAYPKTVVREDVLEKYQLVFTHDRAGRLVDAQEFRLLDFNPARFEESLLEELLTETADTCRIENQQLVIEHLYIERRLTPLNLYLQQASPEATRLAVIDYGQSIRDLAASNIFPGDLLLKNFGVTRNGRVIFYDYDELCLVTECNFRDMPKAATLEEEMQAEAWFYVGEDDVFPEQFISFLGLEPKHLDIFMEYHAEILTAAFWRDLKTRHLNGEVIEVLPYRRSMIAPAPPDSLRRLSGAD